MDFPTTGRLVLLGGGDLDSNGNGKREMPPRFSQHANVVEGKPISPREREALFLTATGLVGRQIADEMNISYQTVKNHKTNAYIKLDVYSAAGAIALLMATDQGFYEDVERALVDRS